MIFLAKKLDSPDLAVPYKGYSKDRPKKSPSSKSLGMKRSRSDHAALGNEDLSSKRIVRRKVTSGEHRHSLSPGEDLETSQHQQRREVRTTSSVLKYVKYSTGGGGGGGGKYSGSKYNNKYTDSEYSENKFDRYAEHQHRHSGGKGRDLGEDLERGSIPRRVSARDHSNHHQHHHDGSNNVRFTGYTDRFDFSLRIGALDVDMHDGELKTCLFNLFKHYGYVHIKVLGRGIERHAFINFTKKEDAQRALSEMAEFGLEGVSLKTEWSKSTLHRYPEVCQNPFMARSRRTALSTRPSTSASRTRHHDDHYDSYGGGGNSRGDNISRDNIHPQSSSREKNYSSRELSTARHHSRELSRDVHTRDISPPSPRDVTPIRRMSRNIAQEPDIASRESRDISYKISNRVSSSSPPSHDRGHNSSSSGGGQSSSRHEPRTVVPITDPSATRTLFVGNLEPDITERELRDLFAPYGRIETVDIKTQRVSGATYAFVKFMTINDAINAKNDMHGRKYGEYRLKIGFGRGAPSGKVWIGNLTCLTDFKEVQQELDRFGLIRKTDYQDGDNHAFIQLDSLDAAQAGIASLTGYRIRNSGRVLKIDLCKPMHLRDDPDFHLRQAPEREDHFPSSPSVFKRKVRDHDYHHHHHHHESEISGRRVKDGIDEVHSMKGERIVSSGAKGRSSREDSRREETRREYRKRAHSPPPGKVGYQGKLNSDEVNGVSGDYHSKRPRVMAEYGGNSRRSERERGGEKERGRERSRRDRERDSKRSTSSEKERRESNRRKEAGEKSEKSDEKQEVKEEKKSGENSANKDEQLKKPVLEPSMSDLVAAKDTALKLDTAPEQLAMETGAGGPSPLEPTVPETLNDLAILYPVAWRGSLVLKNTGFPTRMHLVGGDPAVAETLLRTREGKDYLASLRITQRLRLEQPRLEEVNKRMVSAGPSGYCILLALPGPTPSASLSPDTETTVQLRPLKSLVSYLKQKEAAGIVALSGPEGSDTASASVDRDVVGVLHAFPPCEFSQSQLVKIAPRLGKEPAKEDHIVVLLVKGNV